MKTIEIISGKQKAQFTTKSVTFDGKEFFYSSMSDVKHNAADCCYTFTYDGEVKTLPYNSKDAKILSAIFTQVQQLPTQKKAEPHADVQKQPPAQEAVSEQKGPETKEAAGEAPKPVCPAAPEQAEDAAPRADSPAAEEADDKALQPDSPAAEETASQNDTADAAEKDGMNPIPWATDEPKASEEPLDKKAAREKRRAEKAEEKARKKAEKAAKKAAASDNSQATAEAAGEDSDSETAPVDPEKKLKTRKSIIVFGIVVAVIAVLSLIYFLAFGTTDDPSPMNPSSTESQEYNDIDELINDLQ